MMSDDNQNTPALRLLLDNEITYGSSANGPLILQCNRRSDQLGNLAGTVTAGITNRGALLLRGFPIRTADDFHQTLKNFGYSLEEEYSVGPEPRRTHARGVFSSTERCGDFIIHLHTEVSYKKRRPEKLAFFCKQAPTRHGETVICDFMSLFAQLPDYLQEKLIKFDAIHMRQFGPKDIGSISKNGTYNDGNAQWTRGKTKEEINRVLESEGISYKWTESGLETAVSLPSTILHTISGERVLQTNFEYWPVQMMLDAYRYQWRRIFSLPLSLFHLFSVLSIIFPFAAGRLIKKIQLGTRLVRISDGDKPALSSKELKIISRLLWKNSFMFRWEAGDILILDNLWWGHGRMNVYPLDKRLILASLLDTVSI